jgi:hypothetical protein
MTLAHVFGLPIEETVLQIAPAAAAVVTSLVIAGRRILARLGNTRPGRGSSDLEPP